MVGVTSAKNEPFQFSGATPLKDYGQYYAQPGSGGKESIGAKIVKS
jgi:hypothetical protein